MFVKIKSLSHRKGSVLIFSLIVLAFMLVSALSIATVSVTEKRASLSTEKSSRSFQVADSGVEIMLQKIYKGGFETSFVYLLKHNFDSGIGHLERTAGFFCRERGSFLRHGNRGDGESGNEHKGEDDERKDENGALAMGKRFDFYKHNILANIIALRKVYHKTKKALTHTLQI